MSFSIPNYALRGKPIPTCGICGRQKIAITYQDRTKTLHVCNHCDFNRPYGDGE